MAQDPYQFLNCLNTHKFWSRNSSAQLMGCVDVGVDGKSVLAVGVGC